MSKARSNAGRGWPFRRRRAPPCQGGDRAVDHAVDREHPGLDQVEEARALQHDQKPRANIVGVGRRVGSETCATRRSAGGTAAGRTAGSRRT